MNKKMYIQPCVEELLFDEPLMAGVSTLDPTSDTPSVVPSDEPYDGEFQSKDGGSLWE